MFESKVSLGGRKKFRKKLGQSIPCWDIKAHDPTVELISMLTINSVENCTLRYTFLDSVHGRRSFQYAAPRLWNALPISIRKSTSLDTFKSKLKYHLFNHSQDFMRSVNRYN